MRGEVTLGENDTLARCLRGALETALKEKGHGDPAALRSFCEILSRAVYARCGEGVGEWMERLEERACVLIRSGADGHGIAAAIAEAAEDVSAPQGEGYARYLGLLHAQVAITRALERVEREKREELERRLGEIDGFPDTIAATLDPPTLARMGMEKLRAMTGAARASLFRYQERGIYACDGTAGTEAPGSKMVVEGRAEEVLVREKGAYECGGSPEPCIFLDGVRADLPGRLFLPLVVRGRTTGLVMLERDPDGGRLDGEALSLARRFTNRMAVALENAELHAREQRKIRETVALLELTRAINSTLDLEEILERVARMSVDLCGVTECVVYLRDPEDGHFHPGARYGFLGEGEGEGLPRSFRAREMDRGCLRSLEEGEPVLLGIDGSTALYPRQPLCEHGVERVLLHPLISRERLTGILALFYARLGSGAPGREERGLIAAIAAQASMAIENASLYEDIEKSYFSTIKALAKAIEVKDPYTHGHSERVTEYALIIADAMRLDERDKQKLKYAATLHDIGKIGIAGRVLNKPGALTEEEYSHVKTHPLLGDSIIEPVEFLQEPRPIILHHHERYDGNGYPGGLKGEDIPLCARILSVADAFEAMRSDRPYRRALPLEEAVEELRRNAGTQFDPEVVEVFLDVLEHYGGDPVNR